MDIIHTPTMVWIFICIDISNTKCNVISLLAKKMCENNRETVSVKLVWITTSGTFDLLRCRSLLTDRRRRWWLGTWGWTQCEWVSSSSSRWRVVRKSPRTCWHSGRTREPTQHNSYTSSLLRTRPSLQLLIKDATFMPISGLIKSSVVPFTIFSIVH